MLTEMSRADKLDLLAVLSEKARRAEVYRYKTMFKGLYDWQEEFITLTKEFSAVCLCAANRIGKTYTGTYIDSIHLMGEYPENWKGHKFDHGILTWLLGYSGEKTRDLLQQELFGRLQGGKLTGGLIPPELIVDYKSMSGTSGALREVRVKHSSGAGHFFRALNNGTSGTIEPGNINSSSPNGWVVSGTGNRITLDQPAVSGSNTVQDLEPLTETDPVTNATRNVVGNGTRTTFTFTDTVNPVIHALKHLPVAAIEDLAGLPTARAGGTRITVGLADDQFFDIDDGGSPGVLTSSGGHAASNGSINRVTGELTIVFAVAPDPGLTIYANYNSVSSLSVDNGVQWEEVGLFPIKDYRLRIRLATADEAISPQVANFRSIAGVLSDIPIE